MSLLINVLNKVKRVYKTCTTFDSVLPLFQNSSSNSFVFHFLLFLLNVIFRIKLKGTLSELVWSHVFFAAFICSLVLKSRKQFMWYRKLNNFNSVLLLFPLLALFLSCFSCPLLSSLPLPHSHDIYSWDPQRWLAYHSVLYPNQSKFSIRQDVFTRRVLIDSVTPVFISCFPCLICSSEYSWKVRYQNLWSRMRSLLHLSAAC